MPTSKSSKVQSAHSGSATTMAELMKSAKSTFISPQKGQVLEGIITKLTSGEILVDVGAKTESLVLEKDKKILKSLLSVLKLGDKVSVYVLNPESDYGNSVVSLRKFNDEKLWEKIEKIQKDKIQIDAIIEDSTKGGFLISTNDGISGFLPNSQAVFLSNSQDFVGSVIKVLIIEINKQLKKVIFSQKATQSSEAFEKAVISLKKGEKAEVIISNVAPFGIFGLVNIASDNQVEAFVHISEIAWEKLPVVPEAYKAGDKFEAVILNLDKESKRINLSIKALTRNPFEEKLKAFTVDQKVNVSVAKIITSGIFVSVGEGVEGFIKKDKIPPTVTYKEGSSLEATVVEVDTKKQRLILVPVLTAKPLMYR